MLKHLQLKLLLLLCAFVQGGANYVWGQAPVNTVLWSEYWTGGTSGESPSEYGFEGTTVYGEGILTYTQNDNGVQLYNNTYAGGASPELMLYKKKTWTISNIPTGQAMVMTLTFLSNKSTFSVTSSTSGISISGSGTSWTISQSSSLTSFNLSITNTSSSDNARLDNIQLKVTTSGKTNVGSFSDISDQVVTKDGSIDFDPSGYYTDDGGVTGTTTFTVTPTTGDIYYSGGKIYATAYGSQEFTVTATPDAADEASYKAVSTTFTANCPDPLIAVASDIDLSSSQTLTKGDIGELLATGTKAEGFTGTITYTFESSNTSIINIADGIYSADGVGEAIVTITATPTGGNAENYKPVTQEVAITVNGTNSISLNPVSKTVIFSASTFDIAASVPSDNYNGIVSAESSNTNVATVSVDGTTVTVTPVAVGTATITVTAGTGTYYPATAQADCAVVFLAPEGVNTAPEPEPVTVFEDYFSESSGSINSSWSGTTANGSCIADNTGWTFYKSYGGGSCARFGTTENSGYAITPAISVESGKTYTLTFKAAPWGTESTAMSLTVTGGSATGLSTANMDTKQWNSLSATITATSSTMTIRFSASSKRFFLDEVLLTRSGDLITSTGITVGSSKFASFCYDYPIDLDGLDSNVKAYIVTGTSGNVVTFSRITGKIKGGVPFILYGTPGDYELTVAETSDVVPAGNILVGTLAPTYVTTTDGDYTNFGLNGDKFSQIKDGVVPAHKAYLPVLTSSFTPGARLNIVFEDDETTAINNLTPALYQGEEAVYDLQGRKVMNPQRGLYIVNGKKAIKK